MNTSALAKRLRDADMARRIAAAYEAGRITEGKALNIEAGLAKGGTAASGGAMRIEGFVQRIRDERRSVPRPDSIDRRGRVPSEDGSPWVRAALESRLSPGGAMPTSWEPGGKR